MKNVISLYLLLVLTCGGILITPDLNAAITKTNNNSERGVHFFNGSWDDAKARAKKENKYIFVEAYTEWCGPCKYMNNSTMKRQEVGYHYNNHFISYKINVESIRGLAFKLEYGVKAVPDLLYFSPEGELVYRDFGSKSVGELLAIADKVIYKNYDSEIVMVTNAPSLNTENTVAAKPKTREDDNSSRYGASRHTKPDKREVSKTESIERLDMPDNLMLVADEESYKHAEEKSELNLLSVSLGGMQQQYDKGIRSDEFLYNYAYNLWYYALPNTEVINKYLAKQNKQDLTNLRNRQFVYDFANNLESNAMKVFLKNEAWYKRQFGQEQIDYKVKAAIYNAVATAVDKQDKNLFTRAIKMATKADIPRKEAFIYQLEVVYYQANNDLKNYARVTREYMELNESSDPVFLHRKAWELERLSNKKRNLKVAKNWVEKSINLESNYYNNTTYARILHKLGEINTAKMVLHKAISMARKHGIDYTDALQLLDQMKENYPSRHDTVVYTEI